ncbi:hypothetical protein F7P84_17510 [Edwardsiella anguillarum]|nr:hypothetical protein F7P84_17510 [Edwardsiella anguillarum]
MADSRILSHDPPPVKRPPGDTHRLAADYQSPARLVVARCPLPRYDLLIAQTATGDPAPKLRPRAVWA